jgi:hypothetical protein
MKKHHKATFRLWSVFIVFLVVLIAWLLVARLQVNNKPKQQHRGPTHYFAGARHKWVPCSREDAHCFVKQALQPWHGNRIRREQVHAIHQGRTQGEFCALVQIIGNAVHYHKPLNDTLARYEGWVQSFYRARVTAVIGLLRLAAAAERLPNMELAFCSGDCVAVHNPLLPDPLPLDEMVPAFTAVQCLGSASIPLPQFDVYRPPNDVALRDWSSAVADIVANRDAHPWATRLGKVVYRGDPRSCHDFATPEGYSLESVVPNFPRGTACSRFKAPGMVRNNSLFDLEGRQLTMPMHEEYKYVLYLHGHCHWANRLRRQLFMGAAILKQAGICEEFYGMRLRPWVHYVPVDYNLNNLTAAAEWAAAHEQQVQGMVARMHDYAAQFNTAEFAVQYTVQLLRAYAALLDYEPEALPGGDLQQVGG